MLTKPLIGGTKLADNPKGYAGLVRCFVGERLGRTCLDANFVFQRLVSPHGDFWQDFYAPSRERIEANHGKFLDMVNELANKPITVFVIDGKEGVVDYVKRLQGRTNGEIDSATLRGRLKMWGIKSSKGCNYVHASSSQQVEGITENVRDLRILIKYGYIPKSFLEQ
jgi:nucleoside diphosphate kinase